MSEISLVGLKDARTVIETVIFHHCQREIGKNVNLLQLLWLHFVFV